MKKITAIILFMLFHLLLFPDKNHQGILHIQGWVIENEKAVSKAQIEIWEGDKLVAEMKTNRWGAFSLDVPLKKNYIFTFSKPGHISKKVMIDTQIPDNLQIGKYYFYAFEVELFEKTPGLREEIFREPVGLVFYDYLDSDFNHLHNSFNHDNYLTAAELLNKVHHLLEARQELAGNLQPRRSVSILDEYSQGSSPDVWVSNPNDLQPQIVSFGNPAKITDQQIQFASASFLDASDAHSTTDLSANLVSTLNNTSHSLENNSVAHNPQINIRHIGGFASRLVNLDTPNEPLKFEHRVIFTVQVLATARPIPNGFFRRAQNNLPNATIIHYTDEDNLDKYAIGVYTDMDQALSGFWDLKRLNYEAYIIAFKDGKRVRVKEAIASL